MEQKNVRIPQQRRAIEKKEKIVDAAMRVFYERGYFGTNTAEIAREAGLSTGSVYAYYVDKKDVLLACLEQRGHRLIADICREISGFSETDDILTTAKNTIRVLIKFHDGHTKLYHDEVKSMQYRDEDVNKYFKHIQKSMMDAVSGEIEAKGYEFRRGHEQTFLIFQMVEAIQDELAFDPSPGIDHEVLIDECARLITTMLRKKVEDRHLAL